MPAEALPSRRDAPRQRAGLGKDLKNGLGVAGRQITDGDGEWENTTVLPWSLSEWLGVAIVIWCYAQASWRDGRGRIKVRDCEEKRSWRCFVVT